MGINANELSNEQLYYKIQKIYFHRGCCLKNKNKVLIELLDILCKRLGVASNQPIDNTIQQLEKYFIK